VKRSLEKKHFFEPSCRPIRFCKRVCDALISCSFSYLARLLAASTLGAGPSLTPLCEIKQQANNIKCYVVILY